jgi:hypothetical protein
VDSEPSPPCCPTHRKRVRGLRSKDPTDIGPDDSLARRMGGVTGQALKHLGSVGLCLPRPRGGVITSVLYTSCSLPSSLTRYSSRKGSDLLKRSWVAEGVLARGPDPLGVEADSVTSGWVPSTLPASIFSDIKWGTRAPWGVLRVT